MSLYQTLWQDKKNRTALITTILSIGILILTVLIASYEKQYAPNWLQGLYTPGEYNVGLTIVTFFLLALLYFFGVIAIATVMEIRATTPGWGSLIVSAILTITIGLLITFIKPIAGTNDRYYTPGMRWTIFGCLIGFIILTIVYLFLTETPEEE